MVVSEFFGYVCGVFIGVVRDYDGFFFCVDGGTFFMDEVGEILVDIQVMFFCTLEI